MKRMIRIAPVLCIAVAATWAYAEDKDASKGVLMASGEGYEIHYVKEAAADALRVTGIDVTKRLERATGSASDEATLTFSSASLIPLGGATQPSAPIIAMSSGTLALGGGTNPTQLAASTSPASLAAYAITSQQFTIAQAPEGKLIYTNLKTSQNITLDAAGDVVSAIADDKYVYSVEYLKTNLGSITVSCATTSMFTPVLQLVLTARPLSGAGTPVKVEIDTKLNPTANDRMKDLKLTLKEGVLIVGSLDHYKFDGKEFKVVY